MEIKFKKIRLPLYCLVGVMVFSVTLLFYFSRVTYVRPLVTDVENTSSQPDSTDRTGTLLHYLLEQITGN